MYGYIAVSVRKSKCEFPRIHKSQVVYLESRGVQANEFFNRARTSKNTENETVDFARKSVRPFFVTVCNQMPLWSRQKNRRFAGNIAQTRSHRRFRNVWTRLIKFFLCFCVYARCAISACARIFIFFQFFPFLRTNGTRIIQQTQIQQNMQTVRA